MINAPETIRREICFYLNFTLHDSVWHSFKSKTYCIYQVVYNNIHSSTFSLECGTQPHWVTAWKIVGRKWRAQKLQLTSPWWPRVNVYTFLKTWKNTCVPKSTKKQNFLLERLNRGGVLVLGIWGQEIKEVLRDQPASLNGHWDTVD